MEFASQRNLSKINTKSIKNQMKLKNRFETAFL